MDITNPNNYFEAPSHGEAPLEFYKISNDNPFLDSFPDPLCKLNLKETSEFVKSFPMASNGTETRGFLEVSAHRKREGVSSVTRRSMEAPSTPGRPIFSFSVGNVSRKTFPSKWDDAEKWVINGGSCHGSPAHHRSLKPSESAKMSKLCNGLKPIQAEGFAEKSRVITEENISKAVSSFHDSAKSFNGVSSSADVLLKDKLANEVEEVFPKFRCLEPMKEGFLFGNTADKSMKDAATEVVHEVKHRDVGTEMTPLGSSTTSRCHTPFKSSSPARHNTPASRSGPLALTNSANTTIDITQFQECHLAKLELGTQFDSVTSNWSSREEEEEEISKSLRHFEMSIECRRSVSESRACTWEDEEKRKYCLRYQREEAKIQAWVNLQTAKAEAQSRKLEVKIQKMRSNLEEKLMKRMTIVHRKAEEWRTTAQFQHTEQIQKATEQTRKTMNRQNTQFSGHSSCGCFPCNNHNY